MSVLKGISGNNSLTRIVLYDLDERDHFLHSIIDRLPTDVQRHFIIDEYTDKYGHTYPCISRSASGESTDSIVVVYSICVGELCGGSCVGGILTHPAPCGLAECIHEHRHIVHTPHTP